MKNLFLLITVALLIAVTGFSQKRAVVSNTLKNYAVKIPHHVQQTNQLLNEPNPYVKGSGSFFDEVTIGNSLYDNQSNGISKQTISL